MRQQAQRLLVALAPINPAQYVRRVLAWTRRSVMLIDEPVEIIQRPEWMIAELADNRRVFGDCDDVAVLIATLYVAIGLPVRLVAIRGSGDVHFVHVFPEVFLGQWWVADATVEGRIPGPYERMVEEI